MPNQNASAQIVANDITRERERVISCCKILFNIPDHIRCPNTEVLRMVFSWICANECKWMHIQSLDAMCFIYKISILVVHPFKFWRKYTHCHSNKLFILKSFTLYQQKEKKMKERRKNGIQTNKTQVRVR